MTDTASPKRKRRMARESQATPPKAAKSAAVTKPPSKLDRVQQLLTRENGASIAEMIEATVWQQHSVRGAMAGALRKRGLAIGSDKVDGVRRYRAEKAA